MPPADRSPKSAGTLVGVVLLPDRRGDDRARQRVEAVERRLRPRSGRPAPSGCRTAGSAASSRSAGPSSRSPRSSSGTSCSRSSCRRRRTASRGSRRWLTRFHSQTPAGRAVGLGGAVVVAELADDDGARVLRVGVHRERLAEAHRVDLGTGLRRADREHVARRDRVGRAQARLGVGRDVAQRRRDADDLAAQVGAVLATSCARPSARPRGSPSAGSGCGPGRSARRRRRRRGRGCRRSRSRGRRRRRGRGRCWPGRRGSRTGVPAILAFGTRRITRSESGPTAVPSAVSVKRLIWL